MTDNVTAAHNGVLVDFGAVMEAVHVLVANARMMAKDYPEYKLQEIQALRTEDTLKKLFEQGRLSPQKEPTP